MTAVRKWVRENSWISGLLGFLLLLSVFTFILNPYYQLSDVHGLFTSILPLALAAVAQAVCVIAGGIDLSVGSQMALTSCVAAVLMAGQSEEFGVLVVIIVLVLGLALGAVNGALVVITKVPDIVVTLATSFVFAGMALLVTPRPAGGAALWLKQAVVGPFFIDLFPKALVLLIVIVAIVWIPLTRSKVGLSLYAIGSNPLAAFRSGVSVARVKVISYVITGFFAALAGLALTASTGIGTPVPEGTYVLIAIAAVVLGGVSLAGGVGGVAGPIIAVLVLQLIRNDMTYLRVDPNLGTVAQGLILIGVLMAANYIQIRRARA
ncbi:MAG: ABC transporter permease [Candidatus Limnocylindrales bacterium]